MNKKQCASTTTTAFAVHFTIFLWSPLLISGHLKFVRSFYKLHRRHCPHVVDTRFVTLLYNMQDVSIQNQEMLAVQRLDRVNLNTHTIIKQCPSCNALIGTAQQQTGRSFGQSHSWTICKISLSTKIIEIAAPFCPKHYYIR